MTIKRDYHGWTFNDAMDDVHQIVGDVRKRKTTEYAEFITGYGIIRGELIKLLLAYGLDPAIKMANSGEIVVEIQ